MKGWLVQSVLTSLQNMTCSVFLNSEREMNCPAVSVISGWATGAKDGILTEPLETLIQPPSSSIPR